MNANYVVEMKDIQKSFGSVHAVKNGQFTLRKGEIHSLIGENGAGKSTMMKLLYGMYPFDEGEVLINGKTYESINPKIAIEAGVGMVHQEFMLVDELTVLENIILGFEPKKGLTIDFDAARKMAQKYIDQYDMDVQLDKKISQISVGEAQRVEIIKILARGAEIIILDEPTAGLDPVGREEILGNIRAYRAAKNAAVLMVSHSMEDVARLTDRLLVMNGSRLAMDAAPGEVFEHVQELLDMGLSIPKVTQVFLRLRSLGVDVKNVYTIDQAVAELLRLKEGKGVC